MKTKFGHLGFTVTTYSLRTCLVVMFFVFMCVLGFLNMEVLTKTEDLWIPPQSQSYVAEKYVKKFFGEFPRSSRTLFSKKEGNVLTLESFELLWRVHEEIISLETDGLQWKDMCEYRSKKMEEEGGGERQGECIVSGPTQFWSNNKTLYDLEVRTEEDLRRVLSSPVFPSGQIVHRDTIFGLFTTSDLNQIETAAGMSQTYNFNADFEDTLIDFIDSMETISSLAPTDFNVALHYTAARSMDDEVVRSSMADTFMFVVSYTLMSVFTSYCISRKNNPVESRVGLSLCGILCIVLGLASGYGLCSGMGVPFNQLHLLLPFIVMGIGVDDLIIITFTFDLTDVNDPPELRIKQTLENCGMSIAFTTLTDIVAFLLGATSSIPAIQGFCLYAAFSLIFNFVFQVTAYTALLYLDAKRMNASKMDVFFCLQWGVGKKQYAIQPLNTVEGIEEEEEKQKKENDLKMKEVIRGDVLDEVENKQNENKNMKMINVTNTPDAAVMLAPEASAEDSDSPTKNSRAKKNEGGGVGVGSHGGDHSLSLPPVGKMTKGQYFFSEIYFPFINNLKVRLLVIISFAVFLGVSIHSTMQLDIGLDLVILVPDDSYVLSYITRAREVELFAFEYNLPVFLYLEEVKYHEKETTQKILSLEEKFVQEKFNSGPVTSWVSAFNTWIVTSPHSTWLDKDGFMPDEDEKKYYRALQDFLEVPRFSFFKDHIVFNYKDENAFPLEVENIRISKLMAYHVDQYSSRNRVDALETARDVCEAANLSPKAFPVSSSYKYTEIDIIILKELLLNLSLAVFAVGLISLVVLINPKAVLLVCLLVISVDIEVLGMMVIWGLTLNTVTLVQLVMAVGLVVDYMAHIAHHYSLQTSTATSISTLSNGLLSPNDEKLRVTLGEMAPSVCMGCFTTLLGVLPLSLATSTMFRMFFKMFLSIVTFGALHGFVLLPAILPWITLENHDHADEDDEDEDGVKDRKGKAADTGQPQVQVQVTRTIKQTVVVCRDNEENGRPL